MVFSDTLNNLGIVQQTLSFMRVNSTQWPTWKIVNSCNNYLDFLAGYMIGNDKRFQWDDTNHTKLPIGRTTLLTTTSDYSFLTDEQGNKILTLTGVSILSGGKYVPLTLVDKSDTDFDAENFGVEVGTPTSYDKIADNIIRLDKKSATEIASGLEFQFQRTPSYFTASDATKEPGVPAVLHRGFVIASAFDGALTLGLKNLAVLAEEREYERQKVIQYFAGRNNDMKARMVANVENTR